MADRSEELAIIVRVKDLGSKALRSVNKELGGLEKGAWGAARATSRGVGTAIGNIERLAVIAGGAALTAGAASVKMAMDYESSAASVRKTVEGDVTGVLADIRKMATTTPVDVNDLNEIAAAAGALGVAKGDIVAFTHTVALLGVTTDVTTEQAATSLGHLKTNLKLTGSAFAEVGDELVYLGNNGASTESQILGLAEAISGVAGNVGLSKEAVLGWGAAVANTGEEVEAGGTSIQKFFLTAAKAARTGGDELKTFAKVSGVSAKQFSKDFERDASGTMERFIVKLGKMSKGEQQAVLELLGFSDSRITRALFKLLGNTDNLTQSLNDAQHAAGAMGKEAEQRFKTTASQVQLFKNNIKDAAITIGSELMPEINKLLGRGTAWIQQHPGEIKAAAQGLAKGFEDAVAWADKLDWPGILNAAKGAAGFARGIVDAFMNAPDWLKTAVVTGWGLNKLTGGAVVDVGVSLTKGAIGQLAGQFLGRGSSPANPLWVAPVGGGLGGGGLPGIGGAGGSLLGRVLTGAAGLGLGLGGSALLGAATSEGGPAGAGMGALGGAGMIAGGALMFGPLGAIAGSVLAVGQTLGDIRDQSKTQGEGIAASIQSQIAGGAKLSDLKTSLAAVNTGIDQIESNPLNVLLAGDALDQLKAQRAALEKQVMMQANVTPKAGNATPQTFGSQLSGKERDDVVDLAQLQKSSLLFLRDQFHEMLAHLRGAKTAEAIRSALKEVELNIFKRGKGGVGGAEATIAALKTALASPAARHDPKLAAELRAELAHLERQLDYRTLIRSQLQKADRIVHSSESAKQKIEDLKAIQRSFNPKDLAAQKAIRDRINAVKHSIDVLPSKINPILYVDERPGHNSGSSGSTSKPKSGSSSSGSGGSSVKAYDTGAWSVPRTGEAVVHQREMILRAGDADRVRIALTRPSPLMSAAGARAINVQLSVSVHVPAPVVGLRELAQKQQAQARIGKVVAG